MDAAKMKAELVRLGLCSPVHTEEDRRMAMRLADCLNEHVMEEACALVAKAGGRAALMHYESDATSLKVKHTHRGADPTAPVVRCGRALFEF